jgi:hypothetical protein
MICESFKQERLKIYIFVSLLIIDFGYRSIVECNKMWIGNIFAGEVNKINGECIITKFFMVGVPIISIISHYATNVQVNRISGFEIQDHGSSILLGYIRYWSFALTIFFFGWAYLDRQPNMYISAVISLILFLLSIFWWGRLSKTEVLKRTLYKKYTGIYADPSDLPVSVKTTIYESLNRQWEDLADAESPWTLESTPWISCHKVMQTDLHHYGLAYTMGRYAGAKEKMDDLWVLVMASTENEYR